MRGSGRRAGGGGGGGDPTYVFPALRAPAPALSVGTPRLSPSPGRTLELHVAPWGSKVLGVAGSPSPCPARWGGVGRAWPSPPAAPERAAGRRLPAGGGSGRAQAGLGPPGTRGAAARSRAVAEEGALASPATSRPVALPPPAKRAAGRGGPSPGPVAHGGRGQRPGLRWSGPQPAAGSGGGGYRGRYTLGEISGVAPQDEGG